MTNHHILVDLDAKINAQANRQTFDTLIRHKHDSLLCELEIQEVSPYQHNEQLHLDEPVSLKQIAFLQWTTINTFTVTSFGPWPDLHVSTNTK